MKSNVNGIMKKKFRYYKNFSLLFCIFEENQFYLLLIHLLAPTRSWNYI